MSFRLHTRRRRKIIFRTILCAGAAALFFLCAWLFTLTGNWLLTRAVPPLFSRIAGVDIHASEVALAWDGTLHIRNFRLGNPAEPLLKVPEFSAAISLWQLLRHQALHVEEIRIADAAVLLLRKANGENNWQGIAHHHTSARSSGADPRTGVPRILLKKLQLENASILWRDRQKELNKEIHWENIHATLTEFGNHARTEVEVAGDLHFSSARNMAANARISLHGMFRTDAKMSLQELSFAAAASQCSGHVDTRLIKPGRADLRCHLVRKKGSWEFRQLRLRQTRQDVQQSILDLSGGFSLNPLSYQADLRQARLSGEFLPFLCDFFFGVNPGDLSFDGAGTLAGGEDFLAAQGHWSMSRQNGDALFGGKRVSLPAFELHVAQDFALDWQKRNFVLRHFQADLQSGGKIMAELDLKQPLSYNMTRTDPARLTPDLHLQLSDFRLGLLHFLLPAHQDLQLDGTVSGQITAGAGATPGAAQLKVDLRGDALAFQCAGWNLKDAGGLWQGAIALDEKRERLQCPAMTVQISSHGESLIRGDFSGTWDLSGKEAEILAALGQADEDLLASFPGEIAGFIRKLPLLPEHFQLSADGKLLFRENLFRIEHCRATATGENNAQFTVLLDHQDFRGGDARDRWKFRLAAGAPADLLTPYLPHGVRIYSGNATLDAHADAAPDFQTMTLESDLQLQDWSGAFWEHDFTDGGMQLHTNLYMPSPQRVLINNSDLYFLHYGRPALRAGLSGSANYDGTAMQLAFDLRYLNEQFLNLLLPGRFRTGLLTGKIAASGDLRGTLHTTGMLILDKFAARSATLPSSGFLRFEATQNAAESRLDTVELQLMQAGKTLAKAALRAHCPAAPDAPAQIDVTVEHADLSTLYSGVANTVPQPETELPEERSSRKPFFFGKRPICVGLDLQNLHWGKSARFDLTGDLFFRENNFRTVNTSLRVNGKPIHFSLDLEDTPEGMLLRTRGNVPETLDLASVASIWDSAQIGGNLIRGQWDLFWQNLLQSGGDPEARGHLQADFQDLRVETGGEDPWVRLFLLPVEALVRLRSVLPSSLNLRDQWKSILQSAVDPDSPLAELKFHRGKLYLELDGRKIRIRQADFNGSTIHDLSFTGGIGIAKPFALDLKTAIRAGVLRGALPIRGTLADPDAEISELLTSLTGLNMDQFPDFSPGSWKTLPEKATSTFTRFLQDMIGLAPGQ